jgi:hypothetical protein
MKAHGGGGGGVECKLLSFLASVVDGADWLDSHPCRFIVRESGPGIK